MSIKLIGYSDKLSARPGDQINFHVSNETHQNVLTYLTRSISADPNPAGMGVVETNCICQHARMFHSLFYSWCSLKRKS